MASLQHHGVGTTAPAWRSGNLRAWRTLGWLVVGLLVLVASSPSQARQSYAFSLTGRVVQVADGDTLTLLVDQRRERIRLASIDAPEMSKDKRRPGQPMARQSRNALAELVAGKTVTVQCYERDRYGRGICDVMLPGGSTANQLQVARGMAWVNMEKRGRFMRDPSLPALEREARRQRLGIWQQPGAVAPWVWRYQCWQQGECA